MIFHIGKDMNPGSIEFRTHQFSIGGIDKERFIVHLLKRFIGISGRRRDGTEWFFGLQTYAPRKEEDRVSRASLTDGDENETDHG